MPDIRYVALSDTHFGADNSLLTHLSPGSRSADPMRPSRVLETFVPCLRSLVARNEGKEKPTLVLNGDILELALTTDSRAAMAFERFVDLAFPPGGEALFASRIYYLPGNHDHHLWETAREAQYLEYIAKNDPAKPLDPPWHATNLFLENRTSLCPTRFLETLARRRGRTDLSFVTAYPNLGLVSQDERRAVIFTHGHFAESIYTLVTKLMSLLFPDRIKPMQVWEYEAENFAWIDFFWSALGRSGQAGENIELIYDKLQDKAALDRLLGNLSRGIAQGSELPGIGTWMKAWLLHQVLKATVGRISDVEVKQTAMLSKDTEAALKTYLEGPVRAQILSERSSIPAEVTVVFGHTHKPFERVTGYQGYAEELRLYNSGGWVVDSLDPQANGGWAAVLLDENLDTVSLRFAPEGTGKAMCLAEAARHGQPPSAFHKRLQGLVDAGGAPWSDFLAAVKASTADHLENLRKKIKSPT
jgi:hypothetical protein